MSVDATFGSTPTSVIVHLPAGLVGNPGPFAQCSETSFRAGSCAANSQVGSATAATFGAS